MAGPYALYALCLTPFLMLAIIGVATVQRVREGRYRKDPLGSALTEAPHPAAAVAKVLAPSVVIILLAAAQDQIGFKAAATLSAAASLLAVFVYSAAAKRRKLSDAE